MPEPQRPRIPRLVAGVSEFLRERFRLRAETDYEGTVAYITGNVDFRGGNLWALVLAIVVASIGLNVNSTAIIIGAMLISPLMGPIMGVGLAIGINDVSLLRRSLRNIVLAAAASVVASALYFGLSPLSLVQSELLARTRPTPYDVLVAFVGGSAGIIAASRRGDKGNVVPGVAIATALMPPLCTAGFGIAAGQWSFFFGAGYLFLINSVFISLATAGVVRFLRFPRLVELDPERRRRVRMTIAAVVIVTTVPSTFVAWMLLQETLFLSAANRFVREELSAPDRSIVATEIEYRRDSSTIDVTLVGPPLSPDARALFERRLAEVGLRRTRLVIREPMKPGPSAEQLTSSVRTGILEDLYRRNQAALETREARIRLLEDELVRVRASRVPVDRMALELPALYPDLTGLAVGRAAPLDTARADSTLTVMTTWRRPPGTATLARLRLFLARRLDVDSVDLMARVRR